MHAMLGRGVLRRLATNANKQPASDVTQLTRRLQQLSLASSANNPLLTAQSAASSSVRYFATTDRPVGRPKKGGAVTARSSTRTRTRAAGAAKAKTAGRKKGTKKKAASKKKAAPKRKVLTEAQKQKADARKKQLEVRELKKVALYNQEPDKKPATAWTVFAAENVKKGTGPATLGSVMKDNAQKYRNMSPAEREHYNHLANQNKAANDQAYTAWVTSHTAEAIKQANSARRRLKLLSQKDGKSKRSQAYSPIKDDRQVKRPQTPYNHFFTERFQSGDFKQISIPDSARQVTSEWKALTPSEKKKYDDLYEQDYQRYRRQFRETYGYDVPVNGSAASASASATL